MPTLRASRGKKRNGAAQSARRCQRCAHGVVNGCADLIVRAVKRYIQRLPAQSVDPDAVVRRTTCCVRQALEKALRT